MRAETFEAGVTRKLVDYTNLLHDLAKKAEAARAVVYVGNGSVALEYRKPHSRFKRVAGVLALVVGTSAGVVGSFTAGYQYIQRDMAEQETRYVLQALENTGALATLRKEQLDKTKSELDRQVATAVTLQARIAGYEQTWSELDMFTGEQIRERVAQFPFYGRAPWDNFTDQFCVSLYGRVPCAPLREAIKTHLCRKVVPTAGKTVDETIAEWDSGKTLLRYTSEGIR